MGLSKLSLIFFLSRLTSYGTHKRIFFGVAAFTLLWMLGSFLALALQCEILQPWLVADEQCTGTVCSDLSLPETCEHQGTDEYLVASTMGNHMRA